MNNSGKAVRYWANKENISHENILIITDDLNLPFGTLRLKTKGSDGGHNGLKDIQAQLNTTQYPRLRFGIHSTDKGANTVDFVLGKWTSDEAKALPERCTKIAEMILSFATQGSAKYHESIQRKIVVKGPFENRKLKKTNDYLPYRLSSPANNIDSYF